jgi:hypothetical protein
LILARKLDSVWDFESFQLALKRVLPNDGRFGWLLSCQVCRY